MLRRLGRGLGILGTLWTLAVLGAPTFLHPCPTHGAGHEAHASPAVAAAEAEVPSDAHAAHGAHVALDAAETSPAREPAAPCLCLDCCCSTAPVAGGIEVATTAFDATIPARRDAWTSVTTEPALPPGHRLPFAKGPPALNG